MIKKSLLVIAFLTPSLQACATRECSVIGYDFFHDRKAAVQRFATLSLEDKYNAMICAEHGMHPPMLEFGVMFASSGADGVALLKRKLEKPVDDLTARDIIYALSEMQRLNTYDVTTDRELMTLVLHRVKEVKDAGWRDEIQSMIREISG